MSIELLAPAGSPEALDAAIGEGADAVYLGLKDFNARLRSVNFTYAQFEGALRSLHKMGKKVYVTVNTVFEQREADRMYQFLKYLSNQGPDALIVQDFGVIEMARTEFPSLKLHASTQMNIASARGANALSRHGVSRAVLARELSFDELKSIKANSNLELEVFVHGALCISISGLCLFSSSLGGKSANRGMCTQACRRLYHRLDRSEGESGYYFSPNDLQLLERVPDLASAGIKALKIEGRMKSASYVGAVVSAYRLAADAAESGNEEEIRRSIEQGLEILKNDFARPKTEYLFQNSSHKGTIDWLNPQQSGGTGISLGTIQKVKGAGEERRALVTPPRGIKLSARDSVRIHRGDDSGRISQKLTFAEKSSAGSVSNSYWISASEGSLGDHVYLIQTKEMRKRYAPVITQTPSGKGPGREKAPVPSIKTTKKKETSGKNKKEEIFPEGLYVSVSRPDDLYILQSSRPERVILSLSRKNARFLLAGNSKSGAQKPLPFKASEIILSLDPWFPQTVSKQTDTDSGSKEQVSGYENEEIADEIKKLSERGYNQYIINNLGHFSLFREMENIKLIAGPWFYIFNTWSLSFAANMGADGFISPFENNRQNLERTLSSEKNLRKKFFITVFSWPQLLNIRADLSSILKFNSFSDNTDETFFLDAGNEGTKVYQKKYFSIIDKIPFLKEAGFGRFIIDFSGPVLKKSDYKDLMKSINGNAGSAIQPLPHSSRFNWKNGFFKNP